MKKFFVVFLFLCTFFVISCDNGSKSSGPVRDHERSNDEDADFINDSDETDTVPQNSDGDSGDTLNDNDPSVPNDSDSNDSENPVTDGDASETDDDSEPADDNDTEPDDEPVVIVEGLDYESGFIDLEENTYTLSNKSSKSGRAKIWYDFQPANKDPESKPLFVLYNGGPGSSSSLIFLYNTSRKTADQAFAGEGVADNKWNWNQLGNLLYIDARQTGFSYGIVDNPSNSSARSNYFSTANFNVFVDAADFIRVILRFLPLPSLNTSGNARSSCAKMATPPPPRMAGQNCATISSKTSEASTISSCAEFPGTPPHAASSLPVLPRNSSMTSRQTTPQMRRFKSFP